MAAVPRASTKLNMLRGFRPRAARRPAPQLARSSRHASIVFRSPPPRHRRARVRCRVREPDLRLASCPWGSPRPGVGRSNISLVTSLARSCSTGRAAAPPTSGCGRRHRWRRTPTASGRLARARARRARRLARRAHGRYRRASARAAGATPLRGRPRGATVRARTFETLARGDHHRSGRRPPRAWGFSARTGVEPRASSLREPRRARIAAVPRSRERQHGVARKRGGRRRGERRRRSARRR